MKKRLISMLCASTIAFLLALPSYAFDSDMATSAKVNADIAELKETYSIDSNLMQDVISNYPDAEPQIAALKQQAAHVAEDADLRLLTAYNVVAEGGGDVSDSFSANAG